MKVMKRLTALCLSALLLFSLTACGEKKDEPTQDDTVKEEQQTPAAPGSDGPSQPAEDETADTGVTMKVAAMKSVTYPWAKRSIALPMPPATMSAMPTV